MKEPVELTVNECVDLLSGGVIGRIALTTPGGPRILPVNYAVNDGAVVIRTSPYSELATYGPRNQAAFEIDHFDYDRHQGWSVVALGRLEALAPDEVEEVRKAWEPRPWAGGHRNLYLRLPWREVSGRRIGTGWKLSSTMPLRRAL